MRGYDVSKFKGEVPSAADDDAYENEMVKFISYYAAILQAERGGALGGLNQAWSWLACTLNEPVGSPTKKEKCYPAVVLRFLETVAWQMGRAFQNQFHRIVAQVRLCVCLTCVYVVTVCWCFGIGAGAQVRCWMVGCCSFTQVRCRLPCCRASLSAVALLLPSPTTVNRRCHTLSSSHFFSPRFSLSLFPSLSHSFPLFPSPSLEPGAPPTRA